MSTLTSRTKSGPWLERIRELGPKVSSGEASDQREFTGERFLPGYADGSIELHHVHRYAFALPFVVDRDVLDIACGEGYGSDLMSQIANTVVGIDIDQSTIELANSRYRRSNLSFKAGIAAAIPVENGSADVVTSFETLEHIRDQDSFWAEIKRVLAPDGVLIISSPNRDIYERSRATKNPFHARELTQAELVSELSQRFKYQQLFAQSNVFGSQLTPAPVEALPETVISLDANARVLTFHIDGEIAQPYSLAVASDQPIPRFGQSLYTGPYPPDAMAALRGGIAERDELAVALKAEIAELEPQIQKLTAQREALAEQAEELRIRSAQADAAFAEQKRLLTLERDEALLVSTRIQETLTEQDASIRTLKALVDEHVSRSRGAKGVRRLFSKSGLR